MILRKVGLDDNGPLSALLLLGAMTGAFAGGMVLKGKSGWCSTICPLLPVQRIYGQTPFALVGNNHCQPCVGCAKSCYDFNPRAAYLADLNDADGYWSGYRKFFVGAFPGLVLGFFETAEGDVPAMLLYVAVSHRAVRAGDRLRQGLRPHDHVHVRRDRVRHLLLRGGRQLGAGHVAGPRGRRRARRASGSSAPGARRSRSWPRPPRRSPRSRPNGAASRSIANNRALKSGAPEVHFVPEDKTVVAKPGLSLLEIAESNGMTIESGCRMGICGADPVAIKDGMDCLSGISDDEKATLERLGLAPNTRMACCARVEGPVTVSLKPDKAQALSLSKVQGFSYDKSVANVVVLGNGIAGVTAVDHIRRRHPVTQIDLIAEEPHHLYNRMGIARLVYGKSAMQGLYLNPDSWYGERNIETWLNTRALQIDRANRVIHLGTGEKLPYDRLILAMGSRAFVPPIEGFGLAGSGVLRKADDAIRVRPSPSDTRPRRRRSPAAACSAWRRRTRCTSSGCARPCSSAPTGS